MNTVELTESHLRALELREIERSDLGDNLSKADTDAYLSSDFKKAVLDEEGRVVMVLGGKINGNTCWTWILASQLIYANPVASLQTIIEIEQQALQAFPQVKLLYTYNPTGFPFAIKFLERIGYSEYGRSSDFDDGKERIILTKEVNRGR